MRSGAAAIADAPTCSTASSQAKATAGRTPIDGIYRVHTTASDLRAVETPEGDVNPENYGSFEMVLDRGRTQKQPMDDTGAGTYTVVGHTVTLTYTSSAGGPARNRPGEVFDFGWSLYRDQLTLEPVEGKISPEPSRAKPWRRIGNAP